MPYKDPQRQKEYHALHNKRYCKSANLRRRKKVLNYYGNNDPKCVCCGEKTLEFLSVDHINGGGTQQKKLAGTRNIYPLLIRWNFPEGYRILCHNCNQAVGFYGKCPHSA